MNAGAKPFRWGILGTGFVARRFALGLSALEHAQVAAIGSRSEAGATELARRFPGARAYGSYEAMARDGSLDAIYVASPPALHREHASLCLENGRHVLVEKPFATSAEDAREIADLAQRRGLFCMEAMWTRFLPLVQELKTRISAGDLGEPQLVNGSYCAAEARDQGGYLFDPTLGGGAILDRGIYPVSMTHFLFGEPASVTAETVVGPTGVDEHCAIMLRYQSGLIAQLTASIRTKAESAFSVMGASATIDLEGPVFRPYRLRVRRFAPRSKSAGPLSRKDVLKESRLVHRIYQSLAPLWHCLPHTAARIVRPYAGNGYCHQAAHVADCIRRGATESPVMPLADSVAIMQTIDRIRSGTAPPRET
jgi:predicted dehydrogenase